jgi:hypothetical protein
MTAMTAMGDPKAQRPKARRVLGEARSRDALIRCRDPRATGGGDTHRQARMFVRGRHFPRMPGAGVLPMCTNAGRRLPRNSRFRGSRIDIKGGVFRAVGVQSGDVPVRVPANI